MKIITLVFALSIVFVSKALFSSDSTVVKLTNDNFKKLVLQSDQLWLVEFYAPWCGHCKRSAPQYEKAAEILEGIVNIGAVDATQNSQITGQYGVSGYPTIKFFGNDKKKPIDFSSADRTYEKFVNYCLGKVKAEINNRLKQIKTTEGNEDNRKDGEL